MPAGARQLIVVSAATTAPAHYLATLRAYTRPASGAMWHRAYGPWPAETGYGHLRRLRHEGDGSTPIGVFGIAGTLYGDDGNPGGFHLPYHRLGCGDWWDEDPFSPLYNRLVHVGCGTRPSFASWSEPLWTETNAYPYFAVLRFNMSPTVRGDHAPGSGIFLHSWVSGPTAGCVALPRSRLLVILRWLRADRDPVVEIGTRGQISP